MIATIRLLRLLGWVVLCAPLQSVLLLFRTPLSKRLPHIFHRGCCRILGLDVQLWGERSRERSGGRSTAWTCTVGGTIESSPKCATQSNCWRESMATRRSTTTIAYATSGACRRS